MANALIIVESPAKARTISGYLGAGYTVESSIGHVRDLPASADEIPKAYKSQPWARLGIDVDNDFKPLYVVSPAKRGQVRKLRSLLAQADELYLATDEDREGEAIAWHLLEVLNPRVPVRRMVFHEITPAAIQAAVHSPRQIDRRLVDAQEARRMLDRLYGYEVSPVLWKKVRPRLSAGRVQSVATRIVVERERERMAFVSASYWSITGVFAPGAATAADATAAQERADADDSDEPGRFEARLSSLDGARLAVGRDFGPDGRLTRAGAIVLDAADASRLARGLSGSEFTVRSRQARPYRRRPAAPFITATFQQEAGRKLRMSSSAAMRAAQSLYEKGFITYMRTDNTALSPTALAAARATVEQLFGAALMPDRPRVYKSKAKNAQEAHEAIRPAGEAFAPPEAVARKVQRSEARVYDLIWRRTVASQMTDCTGETVHLRLGAISADSRDAEFSASGTVITHMGFREVYSESGDASASAADQQRRLPPLHSGDAVRNLGLKTKGHETQPPARYTEASLVKRLEQLGVGRPSTYASILKTIVDRGYVWKKRSALIPSFTAFSVVRLLEGHFPKMGDYAFTAQMEDDLDEIARGRSETVPWLSRFYFGAGDDPGLKEKVSSRLGDIDARAVNTISLRGDEPDGDDLDGLAVRVGRFGPYLQRGDDRVSVPDDIPPDELTAERAEELLAQPSNGRVLGVDPASGSTVVARSGRYGPYVQLRPSAAADGSGKAGRSSKPKSASLFKSMTLETVTLEEALKLLSLPRTVGADPSDGAGITAHNGRYGPYVKKGSEIRNLAAEDQIFTVTLEECLELLAQPKRSRRPAPRAPLRELGPDPDTGKPMVLRAGRYGPYVSDGEVNASLRTGDTVESVDAERAAELLADRRARGPSKKAKRTKSKAKRAKSRARGKRPGTRPKASKARSAKPPPNR